MPPLFALLGAVPGHLLIALAVIGVIVLSGRDERRDPEPRPPDDHARGPPRAA